MGFGKYIVVSSTLICILTIILGVIGAVYVGMIVDPTYNRAVSSHLDNAYELNSPEQMLDEVRQAEQGMRDLGLTAEMYSEPFSWNQIPSKSMKFQYTYIAGLEDRIQSVIDWKANTYGKNNTSESMGDVYEQKMMNLRKFIMEDAEGDKSDSDWIARQAWYYNMQSGWYWLGFIETAIVIVTGIVSIVGCTLTSDSRY